MESAESKKRPASSTGATPAQTPRKQKKQKRFSSATKRARKEADRQRGKSRVCIGAAFDQWRALKTTLGLKTDAQLASVLLER